MALIPVIDCFVDEFAMLVIMVDTANTMDEAAKVAAEVSFTAEANAQPGKALRVRLHGEGEPYPRHMTIEQAGIKPLAALEFFWGEP